MINIVEKINKEIQVEVALIEWKGAFSNELYEINNYVNWQEGLELTINQMLNLLADLKKYNEDNK